MGMMATVLNSMALKDGLNQIGISARVMSALRMDTVAEFYIRNKAISHLERGRIVILAAGTGNPYFTTDTAAALRAVEIGAGYSIVPRPTVEQEIASGSLVGMRFRGERWERPLAIIQKKGRHLGIAAEKFIEVLLGDL